MNTWHGYFGIEDLNLTTTQRATLIAALLNLGPVTSRRPPYLNHRRMRLDGKAAIFEALFNQDHLTIQVWKTRLAALFGVDPATVDHTVITRHFATGDTPVVTFSRGGTDYLRIALFGGIGAQWHDSGHECRAYLMANSAQWEPPQP